MKNTKISDRFERWTLSAGALTALFGAALFLAVVIAGYVERDVLRVRGIVLSFVLMGLALIVWHEGRSYVPPPSQSSR